MAMSLERSGRSARERVKRVAIHLLGAALGGAATGAFLGLVGNALFSTRFDAFTIAAAALCALVVIRTHPRGIGRKRQVPRKWAQRMGATQLYLMWGALLGSGVATVIVHPSFLVLAAGQMAVAPPVAAAAGAVFGFVRQAMVIVPLAQHLDPEETMALLPRLRRAAAVLDPTIAVIGAGALVATI